jgi:hypothetical protein
VTADAGTAAAPTLPTSSPFFGTETAGKAVARLKELFADEAGYSTEQRQFAKSVVELQFNATNAAGKRTASPGRLNLHYGVCVLDRGEEPPALVGPGLDDMICIASIGKLAILYAAFQLRADAEKILGSWDAPATVRPKDATNVLAAAFRQADDPALQTIGRSTTTMPVIERIFDLEDFFSGGPGPRPRDELKWRTKDSKVGGTDGHNFNLRLSDVIIGSDDQAATSCTADVGLPYIQALLTRTGLADVSAPKKGLWLASSYGWDDTHLWPPSRDADAARRIVSGDGDKNERPCLGPGSRGQVGHTGQGGTVRALAAFFILLKAGELVSQDSCSQMRDLLRGKGADCEYEATAAPYLLDGLKPGGDVIDKATKVGYLTPWYHDSALFTSSQPADSASAKAKIPTPIRTWIAVVLLSKGPAEITKIAPELEAEVDKYVTMFVR